MPRRRYCKKCGQPLTYRTVVQVRRALDQALSAYEESSTKAKEEKSADYRHITLAVSGTSLAERVRKLVLQMRGECGDGRLCERDAAKKAQEKPDAQA